MLLLFELIIVNFGGVSGIMLGIERTIDCRTPVDEGLFCCLGLIGTNEDMEGRKLELAGFLITGIVAYSASPFTITCNLLWSLKNLN